MAGIDYYRPQKIIFERFLAPQFAASYHNIETASSIRLSSNVRAGLEIGLYKGHRDLLTRMVEADLKLFQKRQNEKDPIPSNNILYVELSAEKEVALAEALAHADDIKAFDPGGKPTRTNQEAYDYYCGFVLGDTFRGGYKYIEWLFKRNPMAQLLLRKSFDNFVTNVVDCLGRVNGDIEALQTCFLEGKQIKSIRSIVSTGSYSQRGGKQVLFLDFAWGEGPHQVKRIVYKPSDVEIDYRIIGKNSPEILQFLNRHADDPGYPKPNQSLCELINGDATLTQINEKLATELSTNIEQLSIPTYVVLPRYPGSKRKKRKDGTISVRKSYGYLEYLAHEPRRKTGSSDNTFGAITNYLRRGWWRAYPNPDWITREPSDVSVCMRTWGRLAATAYVFLVSDLHHDNRRVRSRRAHVIDLEIALGKPMDLLADTFVFQQLDVEQHSAGASVAVSFAPDGNYRLLGPLSTQMVEADKIDATDQLYLVDSSLNVSRPVFRTPQYAQQCASGVKDVLQALAASDHNGQLDEWIEQSSLGKVIVRHSLLENMATRLHGAIPAILGLRPSGQEQVSAAHMEQMLAGYWDAALKRSRKEKIKNWLIQRDEKKHLRVYNRDYAVEIPAYNGADLVNLDIPTYYRRVQSKNLLTSNGEQVKYVTGLFNFADLFTPEEKKQALIDLLIDLDDKAKVALAFKQFFPDTGLDVLKTSRAQKLTLDKKVFSQILKENILGKELGGGVVGGILPDMKFTKIIRKKKPSPAKSAIPA